MPPLTKPAPSIGALVLAGLLLSPSGCGPSRPEPTVIAADSRIELGFCDELGASFVLQSVELRIDGRVVGRHTAPRDGRSGHGSFLTTYRDRS